jgi:hypothetical protein
MSTATNIQLNRQTNQDYVTDWRAVAGVVGIVLVLVVAAVVAVSRNLQSAVPRAPVASVETHQAVDLKTRVSLTRPLANAGLPIVFVMPWTTSGGGLIAAESHSDKSIAEVAEVETRPDPILAPVVVSRNATAIKPSRPLTIGEIEDKLVADLDQHSTEISVQNLRRVRTKENSAVQPGDGPTQAKQIPSDDLRLARLIAAHPKLEGLPLRLGSDCRHSKQALHFVKAITQAVRQPAGFGGNVPNGFDNGPEQELQTEMRCVNFLQHSNFQHPEAVSTWVQLIQSTSDETRREFVKAMALIDGPEATEALVDRAIYDLSQTVRTAAIEALKSRPPGSLESDKLLRALRYPWPTVADHAATAISALQLAAIVPQLTDLLDEPDPQAPFVAADGTWHRTELVRVNHLGNCVLCHAVSTASTDPLRAIVPSPGKPLPVAYYESGQGEFIRADVTYIKQDFSVMKQAPHLYPWPAKQRYDYFIRTRHLTAWEQSQVTAQATASQHPAPPSYPQRNAVLRALRELAPQDRNHVAEL